MRPDRGARRRDQLAREAARLMLDEEVKHYFDAKRLAARRLLGKRAPTRLRYRPADLPSNGEIRDWILKLAEGREDPEARAARLEAMRRCALGIMEGLEPFHPRLIGSVATGHIRPGSDIDLHVFTDDPDTLFEAVDALGHPWHTDTVLVRRGNAFEEYLHVYLEADYDVELSVYPIADRRVTTRSSTDGKPIRRVSPAGLRSLIESNSQPAGMDSSQVGQRSYAPMS